jgi:hypothetical protein
MKDSVDYFGTRSYAKLTAVELNWKLNRRVLAMDLTASMTGGRGFYVERIAERLRRAWEDDRIQIDAKQFGHVHLGHGVAGARAINFLCVLPNERRI